MHLFHNPRLSALKPALLLALLLTAFGPAPVRAAEPRVSLSRHAAQAPALRGARALGRLAAGTPLHLALTLPLRNQAALDTLLRRQYTPGDALYGHFLTSDEFVERFGPTEEDYQAVAAWAESQGLTVTGTHAGRTTLDVAGSAAQVEAAFAIRMNHYQASDGRVVFANSGAPRIARSVAARLAGVAGLSDVSRLRPHVRQLTPWSGMRPSVPTGGGTGIGSGPAGGLSPNDIKYAYDLSTITPLYGSAAGTATGTTTLLDGKGQTIGLFELDGFNSTDIDKYISTFSLPSVPGATITSTVRPVLIDNFNGSPLSADGQAEVTLDIDMALALAPNASAIYSYEGNQGGTINGTTIVTPSPTVAVDIFQKMADDKALDGSGKPLLQVISNSWGQPEQNEDPAIRNAENTIFQKMAAQGQSIFSASGDFGAFDQYDPLTKSLGPVSVDSPASDPFVTAVGGTTLSYSKPKTSTTTGAAGAGSYVSESVWKTGTINNPTGPEGSGGGSSVIWSKPTYQVGLGASALNRDLPDVSLNADPSTGYDIYVRGAVGTYGGTSAAAPLWAAFTALVNQQRGLNGLTTTLGFANPPLYGLARSTNYTTLFHDITLGDNLFYSANVGFDDATGFGSFIGAPLVAALSVNADQGTGTATLTGTVTDNNGLPISGVTVTATSIATGAVKATATTDPTGAYTLTVPAGLALTITVNTSTIVTAAGGTNFASPTPVTVTLTPGVTTAQPFVIVPAHTFAAGLQMISAPYDFTGLGDFATLFGLATPLANPNPRLIQWQPSFGVYVFYPTAPADTLRLGQGYWIKFPTANYLHRLGIPASLTQSFRIPLAAGWNQIGDPFLGAVPLSTVTADTAAGSGAVALTAAASPVQSNLFRYDPTTGAYVAVDPTAGTLDPYNGYWIYAKQAAVLIVPPVAGPPPPRFCLLSTSLQCRHGLCHNWHRGAGAGRVMHELWHNGQRWLLGGDAWGLVRTGADILVVAYLIYRLMMLAKGTRAWQIITGLIVFVGMLLFSTWARLSALSWLLQQILPLGPVAIVILFYPELRHALEEVGRLGFWGKGFTGLDRENLSSMVGEIVLAAESLSDKKIGALLVLERETGLTDIIGTGTLINAEVNHDLLCTLFYPGSPLHDGAVVIRRDRVIAAGCTLPLSESREVQGMQVHTRHKAALGISEQSDALVVVVSEETGIISLAFEGKMARGLRDDGRLRDLLIREYTGRVRPSVRRRRGFIRPRSARTERPNSVKEASVKDAPVKDALVKEAAKPAVPEPLRLSEPAPEPAAPAETRS